MSPSHLARPRRRSWRQRAFLGVGIVLTVGTLATACAVAYYWQQYGSLTRYDVELSPIAKGAPRNYLVVGSDSRENMDPGEPGAGAFFEDGTVTGKRSDTIMILRIDPEAEKASLLSLPRDLWVPIADTGREARINSAYGRGRQVLIDTLRDVFQIEIHHYVEVDFNGFRGLVDAIGGVRIWVDAPIRDKKTGLSVTQTGCVELDPDEALDFVRSRYLQYRDEDGDWRSDPTSDLGRITRQQIFIRRAIKKAAGAGVGNPVTANRLVGVAVDNVGLDPRLGARDIVSLARRFADFDESSLKTYALPVKSGGARGAVVIGDDRAAERILNIFRGVDTTEVSPALIDVEVLNGTGAENQATDVAAALGELRFNIARIGDSDEQPVAQTTILHAPGDVQSAVRLARHVTGGAVYAPADFLDVGEVVLITGTDFTTIHRDPAPAESVAPSTSSTTAATGSSSTTTTTAATTTTTAVGVAIGAPPEGEEC
jgi:LCP family protein required for cell wall assembly